MTAAIKRVYKTANPEWVYWVKGALQELIDEGIEFTSEDVLARVPPNITTHDTRAVGPIMRSAARSGQVVTVGWRLSKRPVSHSRPMRVYVANV